MSKSNVLFTQRPVDIPNISGHDMSHEHLTSMMFGTLHPTLCMEVMPDSTVDCGMLTNVSLPPFAAKFNGKVDLKTEAFFVPMRILWGGWKDFISQKNQTIFNGEIPGNVPTINIKDFCSAFPSTFKKLPVNRTFMQQLGYVQPRSLSYDTCPSRPKSAMPLLAYQRIWSDWYRDPRLQQSPFTEATMSEILAQGEYANCPLKGYLANSPWKKNTYGISPLYTATNCSGLMADLVSIFVPRPRLWAKDFFTTAIPHPTQQGTEKSVTISGNSFTINSLRAANALAKYAEKLAVVGDRYEDIIAATYGVRPSDAVLDRPLLLGSSSKPLYAVGNKSMYEPTNVDYDKTNPYQNMFGAETGRVDATDGFSICHNFTSTEAGYIVVLQSVVPHAYYNNIGNEDTEHYRFTDFANPAFANLGRVPIYEEQVNGDASGGSVFGYCDRYSEYKFRNDRVTGEMSEGGFLDCFAFKRPTLPTNTLNTYFLEMRPDVMDGVLAYAPPMNYQWSPSWDRVGSSWSLDDEYYYDGHVNQREREFEVDTYFDMRVSNPLPVFAIPSLEGPKGNTRFVPNGGTRI